MKLKYSVAIVVLLASGIGTIYSLCPAGCQCSETSDVVNCRSSGLNTIPPGYFPNTTFLYLEDNEISSFDEAALTGFPNLVELLMSRNQLKQLDLNALAGLPQLWQYGCLDCEIDTVIPLEPGKKLPSMRFLNLQSNNIKEIGQDFLDGCEHPNLDVSLIMNPLVLSGTRPFLSANNLYSLGIDGVSGNVATKETFKKLPHLGFLHFANTNVTDVSDIFTTLPNIIYLDLSNNPIKEIRKGFLSQDQRLEYLLLDNTSLESIETDAINGILLKRLSIKNTPLACECDFEYVYWWAQENGVTLWADCTNRPPCEFGEA